MMKDVPHPDVSRFSPLSAEIVALAYLERAKGAVSPAILKSRFRPFMDPQQIEVALSALVTNGRASVGKSIGLTEKGKEAARKALGRDTHEDWEKIWKRRFPLIVLGLDPDDADTRRKFAKADALTSAAIAVAFGLQGENIASKSAVCGELVWRILKAALPEVVGRGPFPAITKLGTVERVVLGGFAKVQARNIGEAVSGLAAVAVELKDCNAETLRKQLVHIGLRRAILNAEAPIPVSDGSFAARIKEVASSLSTPPFQGRVSIAQVYDAYGRVHPDAGSLVSFKERLVAAAKSRALDLGRLDMPERMDRDLRLRSETRWGTDEVHFVITTWK